MKMAVNCIQEVVVSWNGAQGKRGAWRRFFRDVKFNNLPESFF